MREHSFDSLPFNLLVAGEIELITREGIEEDEKEARLAVLKTIAYHKLYLQDNDLRDGYDKMMKKIERGQQQWCAVLGEHLHEFLNYRANIIFHDRIQTGETSKNTPFTKVESRKQSEEI